MKTLIRCGHLIDGTGSPTTTNMVLVIEGDRLLEVCDSNSYSVDPDDDLVDLSEHWVLPGLIDALRRPGVVSAGDVKAGSL